LAGQSKSVNKNDDAVNLKVLEERIKQIEDKTKIQIDGLEKKTEDQKNDLKDEITFKVESLKDRMNLILWIFGIFAAFITFLGFKTIVRWIKQTIEIRTDDYLKKEKFQEKIGEIGKLVIDYENALNKIKNIKDIGLDKPLPEESKENLAKFADKLAKFKKEERYSFNDLYFKGLSELGKNNYEEAINNFTKAIELDPKDASVYNNRGNAYANLNKYEEALNDYNKAIELDPKVSLDRKSVVWERVYRLV
jgi:tetratricopeptide (TPR) repeat protein